MKIRGIPFFLLALPLFIGIYSASGGVKTADHANRIMILPDQGPGRHWKTPGIEKAAPAFIQRRLNMPGRIDDIIVAKLDKDNYSDLAIIDYQNHKIRTLMGDNTLEFKKRFEKPFQDVEDLFAGAADFTGDGKIDLAIDNFARNILFSVFPGDGLGRLRNPLNISAPAGSDIFWFYYASPANLNGDAFPDIVGLAFLGKVLICRNIGKGRFTTQEFDYDAGDDGLVVGDFTGDGVDDFLLAEVTHDKVYFYKNNGAGTFAAPRGIPVKDVGHELYAADLNGDGKLDLVGAGDDEGQAWTMLGKGNGTFWNKKILGGDSTLGYGACLADFNGDKKIDIASAEEHGMYYYSGLKTGAFGAPVIMADSLHFDRNGEVSGARNAGFGYFNNDTKPDVVGVQYFGSTSDPKTNLVFFLNGGTPASFQISNLQILYSSYNGTNISLRGSVDFSGSGLELHYNSGGDDPTDSAFLQFKVYVQGSNFPRFSVTYAATGEFIHKPGMNSGTITFDLTLPSPTIIYPALSPSVTLDYFYVLDDNLVSSNTIE